MTKNIKRNVSIKKVVRVNKDLLINLQNLLSSYAPDGKATVKVLCEDDSEYRFNSFSEFLAYDECQSKRMAILTIDTLYPGEEYGSISIEFRNDLLTWALGNVNITFNFHNEDNYFLLKTKLLQLFNNYYAPYSILTRLNITALISLSSLVFICIYTNCKHIIFSKPLQNLIFYIAVGVIFPTFLSDRYRKLKHRIFPYCEFNMWHNNVKKYRSIRNFLGISVIGAFLIGLITNIFSSLFGL